MIRDENGMLAGYVYVDIAGRDIGGYVDEAKQAVARRARRSRPATRSSGAASTRTCCGSRERLKIVLPITIFLIFLLLYMNTKSAVKTADRHARRPLLRGRRGLAALRSSATTSRSPSGWA